MKLSSNQTRWERHHNTLTPSLLLVTFWQQCVSCVHRRITLHEEDCEAGMNDFYFAHNGSNKANFKPSLHPTPSPQPVVAWLL